MSPSRRFVSALVACVGRCRRARALLASILVLLSLLTALSSPALAEVFPKPDANGTVEVSVGHRSHTLVLFLSGDGGWWGDIDAVLAEHLARDGYAVVGLDTDVWFTDARTPAQVAAHLSHLAMRYGARTGASRYVFVGYSFGADVLPLALSRMSPFIRTRTAAVVLIAPERRTTLKVTALEQSGIDPGNIDLSTPFAQLPRRATICIYGASERSDSGCTETSLRNVQLIGLPGGHHFGHDIKALSSRLYQAIRMRAVP